MTFDEAVKFLRETYDDSGICEVVDKATAPAPEASEELKQAFRLAYDAYSTPADKYNSDFVYIVFLRTKITACFSILQKLVYPK